MTLDKQIDLLNSLITRWEAWSASSDQDARIDLFADEVDTLRAALTTLEAARDKVIIPKPTDWWVDFEDGNLTVEYADSMKLDAAHGLMNAACGPDFYARKAIGKGPMSAPPPVTV